MARTARLSWETDAMAQVNAENDGIKRYILRLPTIRGGTNAATKCRRA
jgi:hypothetical protein